MTDGRVAFDRFVLDSRDRRLTVDGAPIELNTRYFDALMLLVGEAGRLVSKDRFLDEVWRGVPVTDEALTQCVKTLRRQLGDDAARPRFIETVPKHGYRFIASVGPVAGSVDRPAAMPASSRRDWRGVLLLGGAGTIGGGIAGLIGGLIYGFLASAQPLQPGMGATSVLLVLLCLTIAVALIGGAGVAFGIAAAAVASGRLWRWAAPAGAAGGMMIGGVVNLLGIDAFNLVLGRSPAGITGAGEGLLVGGAVGLGGWLAERCVRAGSLRWGIAAAALTGGIAGASVPLVGGRLMAGSLDQLALVFPDSRLRIDRIGALFGESGLGQASLVATGALEGALFAACVVAAMTLAWRDVEGERR